MIARSKRLIAATATVAVAAGLLGCRPAEPATENAETPKVVPVKAVSVAQTSLDRITTQPATVHPYYRAEVRAKTSGYVSEVKADIGDVVKAGDVLAVVDVPELEQQRRVLEAKITRLRAEERRAESGVELATADVRSAEAQLRRAESEMASVEASLAASESEFSRTEDLVQRQSLERRMLDEARKRRDTELANRESVTSAIKASEAEVAVAEAQRNAAEADLEAAKAETTVAQRQLDQLDAVLAYSVLKAPFNGVVTERTVDPGDLVLEQSNVTGEPLFVVSQNDRLRVRIPVPESNAAHVKVGDPVTLTFPSFASEEAISASVTRTSGSLDEETRTMLVEAEVGNPNQKLLPGMFGQATIALSTGVAANVLPARAVRFSESSGAYVYVIDEEDTVEVVPVKTGRDDGSQIEIVAGLEPGQKVVDAHLNRFVDGQQVKLLDE